VNRRLTQPTTMTNANTAHRDVPNPINIYSEKEINCNKSGEWAVMFMCVRGIMVL
jgi:hypothetical protein